MEALGINKNKPENKNALDILTLRESRLDAARVREAAAMVLLADFLAAEKAAVQAQATAATAASGVLPLPATVTVTIDKKVMKRELPKPRHGLKDASSKTHKVHLDAITFQKALSIMLWQLMDIVHVQSGGGLTPTPKMLLARLIPYATIEEIIAGYSGLELLQMMLNYVDEAEHSVYIKHVYNGTVADICLGDKLFGADRTIPIENRVDSAVKRVQKLTTSAKAAVGQIGRGGYSANKRGGAGRRGGSNSNGGMQDYSRQNYYSDYIRPSFNFGRPNNGASGSYGNSGAGSNAPRTYFICGSTGHQAKQCSKV